MLSYAVFALEAFHRKALDLLLKREPAAPSDKTAKLHARKEESKDSRGSSLVNPTENDPPQRNPLCLFLNNIPDLFNTLPQARGHEVFFVLRGGNVPDVEPLSDDFFAFEGFCE